MPPRRTGSLDQQFPLKPLDQHHDLATWHRRSEEAMLRHYSDTDHMNRLRNLMGIPPLQTQPRAPAYTPIPGTAPATLGPKGQGMVSQAPAPPPVTLDPAMATLEARRDQLMNNRLMEQRRDALLAARPAPPPAPTPGPMAAQVIPDRDPNRSTGP